MKKYFTYLLSVMLLTIAISINLFSQVDLSDLKGDLPKMLGANNVGKEFWFAVPPCYEDESGGYPNFVKVFVTSPVKTLVTLEVPGRSFKLTQNTVPNDIIEFNIPAQIAQPFSKGGHDPAPPDQVYKGYGFHVFADQPLVVYVMIRYRYTSDGFLALPISSLGKEYICASYPDMSAMYGGYYFPSEVTITGAYQDTKVKFTVGGNVVTKTSSGYLPGQTVNATLQPGDVWVFSSKGAEADLSGSKVISSKPVSVISGNQCTNIPTNNRWCDYTVEADLPTFTWGTDYHVGKVPKRKYPSIIRIFAKEANTKIYRDGNQIGVIPEGGGQIGRGYFEMRMVGMDEKPRSVVISGDKPIAVTLYNCGVEEDGYPHPNSDPFVMSITPVQQYQKEITFCTPGVNGSGYPENYINLVYETNEFGMIPEDLEFAEVNSGQYIWYKVRSKFAGTDEMFRKKVNDKDYAVKTITLPKDGVYKIRAKSPFAAYSFGYSSYDSYGYPTSAALADLEKPDTLCPVPIWKMNCQGEIIGATVEDMPRDPAVRSNLAMIVLHSDSTKNFNFSYKEFEPGAVSTTTWEMKVIDPTQDAYAKITFTDRRGNDTTITIRYVAVKLGIEPKFADWGTLKLGDVVEKDFEAINLSEESPVLLKDLKLRTGSQGFEIDLGAVKLPIQLEPLQRLPFKVRFRATIEGEFKDSVGLGDTCFFWYKSFVKAKVGEPIIEVTDLEFGDNRVGVQTPEKEMFIRNLGSVDLVITDAVGPTSNVFTTDLQYPTASNPIIIAPKKEHKFMVKFKADAVQDYYDQIVFTSDAGTKIDNVGKLHGRGLAPDLIANGYDWGRRRITRPNFPTGPYPADNNYEVIKLVNYGTYRVKITGIRETANDKGDAFLFDRAIFDNMIIDTGEVNAKYVEVKFQPKEVGEHKLSFKYINDAGSETETVLTGIGILPKIKTYNYNFDTTMVNDKLGPKTRTIVFTNDDYTYGDDLTLTDFAIAPNANDISINPPNYGNQGFRFDKNSLGLPIVIQRGQSITFNADFMAQRVGPAAANLTSVSDAETDVTSFWNGYGLSPGISGSATSTQICTGTTDEITVTISNTGTGDLDVYSLEFAQTTGNLFRFKNPSDANGFTLEGVGSGKDKKTIVLVFDPGQVKGVFQNKLIVKNSTQDKPQIEIDLSSEAVHFSKTANMKVHTKESLIGQPFTTTVEIAGGDDIQMAQVRELNVVITYNPAYLRPTVQNITLGTLVAGKFTFKSTPTIDEKQGKITAILTANPNQIFNGTGELLKVIFDTYLPNNNLKDADKSVISPVVTIIGNGNACVDVNNNSDTHTLLPTCVYDLRKVASSGQEYMLSSVSPNPVKGSSTSITFGVGLEAQTDITIVNSNGQIIAQPVNENYKPGVYELNLNVENMPSGVYFIKMQSGPFTATRELVITK